MLVRSFFGILVGVALLGALVAQAPTSAAFAATQIAALPSSAPPPVAPTLDPVLHHVPTPEPTVPLPHPIILPVNRVSIDAGATWIALDRLYFTSNANGTPAQVWVRPANAAPLLTGLKKNPLVERLLVYWSGGEWTFTNAYLEKTEIAANPAASDDVFIFNYTSMTAPSGSGFGGASTSTHPH